MNDNGKNQGQPRSPGRRNQPRQGQQRHGGHPRGQERTPGKAQRDTSTLGVRTDEPRKPMPLMDCVICGKSIFDLSGALADKESGAPVHFDCVFERLSASEPLEAGEKLVYLGAGCFGVVTFKNGTEGVFVINRRIRWEKEGEKQAWRKDMSSYITKI
ncbi:MAG: hypothetical protein NT061_11825 [Spirochaetes bacterium]|nr:hypothetical protein [Spirochaetota bacterium]